MRQILQWIQGFAESLGGPGLFLIALLDSSFLTFPQVVDALIVVLTVSHPERMPYYALASTVGSMAGCYALYLLGRKGGEAFLKKRFHARHIERAMATFQRYGMLAIIVPSLMPPPMPFKLFVLAAGVARVKPLEFIAAVAIGRGIRYFGEGFLTLWYGAAALAFLERHAHTVGLWLGLAVLTGGVAFVWWKKTRSARV